MPASSNPATADHWFSFLGGSPNRAKYSFLAARQTGVNVSANVEYQLARITIESWWTKFTNAGDPTGDHACAGCLDPVCLVLHRVSLDVPVAEHPPDGKYEYIDQFNDRGWVTWQGGAVPAGGCPAATPTARRTWGEVRSLYR